MSNPGKRPRVSHPGPRWRTTDAVHDVVLAVNEAVSNAVVHAYSPATAFDTVDVTLRAAGDTLRIEVVDHGRWRRPSLESTRGGLGIPMMNRLMDVVFIHYDPRELGWSPTTHWPEGACA